MAHFAKLDVDNNVIGVHVLNNDVITIDEKESEQAGIDFLTQLHGHSLWKQTSYNKNFRFNFASPGYLYDPIRDGFIPPKCHDEAIINELTCQWTCTNPDHDVKLPK